MSLMTSLNLNQDDRHLLQDQKNSALWSASFWGHPAWTNSGSCSLSTPAIAQLAIYHRINAAIYKKTVAEMICGVKCVIPNSKLAKYGDFRYDTDSEDMYYDLKDAQEDNQLNEAYSKVKDRLQNQSLLKSSCFEGNTTSGGHENVPAKSKEDELQFRSEKSMHQWLNRVKRILEDTRRIATDAHALDSRTEGLIKLCLRFIRIAKGNSSVVKVMGSDIPFIIDFNQLRREPVSRMELLSLPQPEFEGDFRLDRKSLDALWLQLASPQIRRLWANWNPSTQSVTEEATHSQKYSLLKVNFLRRFRRSNRSDSATESLKIPRETEMELLGSLLQDIEETSNEPCPVYRVAEGVKKGYYAPPSKEWLNQLYSHFSLNTLNENTAMAVTQRMVIGSSADKKQTHYFPPKAEHLVPPGFATLPLRFYKSTPPPSLGSSLNVHQNMVRQPCIYWQTMNGTALTQNSYQMPQQVQENISSIKTNNPPPGFIQTPVRLSTRNYNCPQRSSTPVQLTLQYSRNHPRMNNPKNVIEILKRQSLNERMHVDAKNILRRNEEILNTNRMDEIQENKHVKHSSDSASVLNKVPPLPSNYETILPFAAYQNEVDLASHCSNLPNIYIHENERSRPLLDSVSSTKKLPILPLSFESRTSVIVHQNENVTRSCNFFQPAAPEKYEYRAVNIYSKQLNYPPQKHESRIPLWTNNPEINYSLPPPGIHNMRPRNVLSRMPVPGRASHKTRFFGGVTLNYLRQVQEKVYSPNNAYLEMEDNQISDKPRVLPLKENTICYEDKVTKWLETVNQTMESGSYSKCESSCQISSNSDKLDNNSKFLEEKTDHANAVGPAKIMKVNFHRTKDNVSFIQTRENQKNRKKNVKKLLLAHLSILDKSLKLKKGYDLEGKIKLIKRYFAEIRLKGRTDKTFLTQNTINAKIRKRFHRAKREKTSDKHVKSEESNLFSFEINFEPLRLWKHNSENWRKFSKCNDEVKILYRENIYFNGFPSKRSKLKLFEEESWTYNELAWKISCINYLDMLTNDLFFSKKNEPEKKIGYVAETTDRIDGWTHFKIVVKSILKNILKTLKIREEREKKK